MPVLYRASAGYLLRHPFQLALALFGIAVGVAVMLAVELTNNSARSAFLMSMRAVAGSATHQIVGGPGGVDEDLYAELRVQHGIGNLAPVIDGHVEAAARVLRLLGVDLFAERELRDYTRPGAATAGERRSLARALLTQPGAVLMSRDTAAGLGVAPGDSFGLIAGGSRVRAELIAYLDAPQERPGLDGLVVADIATAQSWLRMQGRLSRIDARLDGADAAAQHAALARLLPDGVTLLEAEGRSRAVAEMSAAFMTNLTAMSLLALLVGVFLIYNSVSFAVLQRRGLLGVLRALGLTRGQTCALVLGEAAALGLVGAAAGAFAGLWLAQELLVLVSRSINDLYFRVTVTDVVVSPAAIAAALATGLAATLAAAAAPALEAAACPPRLALARSVVETRSTGALPRLSAAGLLLAVLAGVLLLVSGRSLTAGLVALFLLILGSALCIPIAVRLLSARLAPLARALGGYPARLAVSGVGASLSRTGVAVVALAIAVSATVGVSVMVDSFRGAVSAWLDNTLRADVYASAVGGSLRPETIDAFARTAGVAEVSSSRRVWLESGDERTRLVALDMASRSYAGTRLLDAAPENVWPAFENRGAVLVSETYGYRHEVGRGDAVRLPTARGMRAFPIAATYRSYNADPGAILISRRFYDLFWDDPGVDGLGLYFADDADPATVTAALRATATRDQPVELRSTGELRERSLAIFDRTFLITDVLYWLAVGVAFTGILGALLALQMERARELAILRALGMTPVQLGSMVTLQSGFIGLLSGAAALPLGLVMAWVLIEVINRRAFGWSMAIAVEPAVLGGAVGLAVSAALLAGLYPAWRAARSRPALAMREE